MIKNNIKTKKRRTTRFFEIYISKILKQISSHNGITYNSKQQLNSFLCILIRIITLKVFYLTDISKKKTLSKKELFNSIKLVFPTELALKICEKAKESIITIETNNNTKVTSKCKKAGISIPSSICEKFLRNFGNSKRMVTSNASIVLATAIEYILYIILKETIKYTIHYKRKRITIRDLELTIRNNKELNQIFIQNNICFIGGGVVPFIHPHLNNKEKNQNTFCSTIPYNTNNNHYHQSKKKKHYHPSTIALREIRKHQQVNNCLIFAKLPFETFVRNIIIHEYTKEHQKISKNVFIILQHFVEQKIIDILYHSNLLAIHAGRENVIIQDILLVLKFIYFRCTPNLNI